MPSKPRERVYDCCLHPACFNFFETQAGKKKYCSEKCRKTANWYTKNGVPENVRVCAYEGCEITFGHNGTRKRFCSRQHQMLWVDSATGERMCTVEGCDRPQRAREMCSGHWYRWRHAGSVGDKPLRVIHPVGTKRVGTDGYVSIKVAEPGVWELEHRVVMSQMCGRDLKTHENVHHKNGNRSDNSPENLELWTVSQPAGQRVEDKLAWARAFLAEYDEEAIPPQMLARVGWT